MKKSPELLVGIVVLVLIIIGVLYYAFAARHAQAPTTATTTPAVQTSAASSTADNTASSTSSGYLMLRTYTDPNNTFTFNYPNAGTLSGSTAGYSQDWMLNATANGLLLVKVDFPKSLEPNTNFVEAYLTVGTSSDPGAVAQCLAAPQSDGPVQKSAVTINGTNYTRYVENGVGAGQIYQTVSYRTVQNGQCYAIEYTIHSANIDNFPPNTVTAFNQAAVQSMLDNIVQSFKFL